MISLRDEVKRHVSFWLSTCVSCMQSYLHICYKRMNYDCIFKIIMMFLLFMWNIKKENVPIVKRGRSEEFEPTFIWMDCFNLAIFTLLSIARVQWQLRSGNGRTKTWVCRDGSSTLSFGLGSVLSFALIIGMTLAILAILFCKPTGSVHGISDLCLK